MTERVGFFEGSYVEFKEFIIEEWNRDEEGNYDDNSWNDVLSSSGWLPENMGKPYVDKVEAYFDKSLNDRLGWAEEGDSERAQGLYEVVC